MKKIILTLLISGCILGLSPKIVYSQTLGPEKPNQDLINKPGAGAPIGNQPVKNFSGQTLTNSDGSVRTINDTLGPPAPTSCDSGWVLCNMMKLVEWIADKIGNFILTIASWILWACGAAFNFAITFFVIEMNERINSMGGIYIVWKTLRDLANMFFIFILLVIAIQTILGSDAYKKTLRNIILVALFINFSFFFTSVLIDFSNILALQFYKGFANKDRYDGGISETIVGVLRLGTIYDANPKMGAASTSIQITENNKTTALSASQGWGRFFVTIIGGSILMVVTGGILLASSILIIFRFIELIIILMISPLAFATLVLPGAKGYAWDPWIKKLKTQLIFAPVYFMFLWITIKIITSPGMLQVTEGKSFTAGFQGDARALFGLIAGFVITISMLTYSLTIAKELGAAGSDMAAKVSKGFNDYVRKNTVGLAARHTVGWAAQKADKVWEKQTGIMGGSGWVGSKLRGITTQKLNNADFAGAGGYADYEKSEKARLKAYKEQERSNTNARVISTGMTSLGIDASARTAAQNDEVQALANYAKTASPKDLAGLKAKELEVMAEHGMLTPDKLSAILDDKNENHNAAEKDNIRKAYSKEVDDALKAHMDPSITDPAIKKKNEDRLKAAISNLGEDGIKIIDPSLTTGRDARSAAFIQMASGKQYKKIVENTYGEGKNTVRSSRFENLVSPATSVPDFIKRIKGLDSADIAHFANTSDKDPLYQAAFNRLLSLNDRDLGLVLDPRKLNKAWTEENLSQASADSLRREVDNRAAKATPDPRMVQIKKQMDDTYFGI